MMIEQIACFVFGALTVILTRAIIRTAKDIRSARDEDFRYRIQRIIRGENEPLFSKLNTLESRMDGFESRMDAHDRHD